MPVMEDHQGHCRGCGSDIPLWFVVQKCDRCLEQFQLGMEEILKSHTPMLTPRQSAQRTAQRRAARR